MDGDFILKLIGTLCAVAMVAGGLVKYIQWRHEKALAAHKESLAKDIKANADRIGVIDEDVKEALNGYGNRLQNVEREVAHLPSKEDIGRLFARIDEVNGNVRSVMGGQDALSKQVTLLNEHLLQKERAK